MNKSVYFPALGGTYVGGLRKDIKHENGKSFNYFENSNGIFKYRKGLITAGHFHKLEIAKEFNLNFEKDIMLGDSGGFQLSTGSIKYSIEIVEKIFNWLENNSNFAMNLDFPPYRKGFSGKVLEDIDPVTYFNEKMEKSIEHFKMFEKKMSGKTKFLNVLHGRNIKELDKWYENVKQFNFPGGWSIGSLSTKSTNDIYLVLLTFFYLYEKKEIQKISQYFPCFFHFLGFSKVSRFPVISYLQQQLNKKNINVLLSFDSSSPILSAQRFGKYWVFINTKGIQSLIFSNLIIKNNEKMSYDQPLPCSCPVCKQLKLSDIFKYVHEKGFTTEFYMYTAAHNIFKLIEYKHKIDLIIEMDSQRINEEFFDAENVKMFKIINQAFKADSPINYIVQNKQLIINIDNEKQIQEQNTLNNFFE